MESKREKETETWRSVVGTVSPRAAPRPPSSRSTRGPRAPRSAVALAAGCVPGEPAALRRRRRGATGVPALPARVSRPRSRRFLASGSYGVGSVTDWAGAGKSAPPPCLFPPAQSGRSGRAGGGERPAGLVAERAGGPQSLWAAVRRGCGWRVS